jgi:hypothetical protein
MAVRQVVIDWDWGATGIWSVSAPDDQSGLAASGQWLAHTAPVDHDRHRAWRGLLSDDLIEALQTWNDRGDELMGRQAHKHSDRERAGFWADGQILTERTQQQLGSGYEVVCQTPETFSLRR